MNTFETPVLLLIFNRPDHARQVMERIREVRPAQLFVGADGPRATQSGDIEKCKQTRNEVTKLIDWPCEVKTLFQENNLGCGGGPAAAISWFFEQNEEGIILEDDCLPELAFFNFCSTLLKRYRNEKKVMHISGNNFQNGIQRGSASYYFSAYNHNWGWASWRRSWVNFNYAIDIFDPIQLTNNLTGYGFNNMEKKFWLEKLNAISQKTPKDIWDYQWSYAIWKNSGLSILPNVNLVVNIGFGSEATHTKAAPFHWTSQSNAFQELTHPDNILINQDADHYTFNNLFHRGDPFIRRVKNKMLLNPLVRWAYQKIMAKPK